jgi:hypothetical protein
VAAWLLTGAGESVLAPRDCSGTQPPMGCFHVPSHVPCCPVVQGLSDQHCCLWVLLSDAAHEGD